MESGLKPKLGSQSLSQAMNTWLWDTERNSGSKSSTLSDMKVYLEIILRTVNLD